MSQHNVNCTKGYANIAFIVLTNNAYYPLSGAENCAECNIIGSGEPGWDENQVKKTEKN